MKTGLVKWAAAAALLIAIVGIRHWPAREPRVTTCRVFPPCSRRSIDSYDGAMDESAPAYVASMSTGIPMWPALMLAEEGPLRFAATECRTRAGITTDPRLIDAGVRRGRSAAYIVRMSIAEERALRKAMRDHTFERVYYFRGDDDFLKESTARELVCRRARSRHARLQPRSHSRRRNLRRSARHGAVHAADVRRATHGGRSRRARAEEGRASGAGAHTSSNRLRTWCCCSSIPPARRRTRVLAARSVVVDFAELEDERVPAWIAHHADDDVRRDHHRAGRAAAARAPWA